MDYIYIQSLREAICKGHGRQSKDTVFVPVEEVFQGRTLWNDTVEVFDFIGHASAVLAYVDDCLSMDEVSSMERGLHAALFGEVVS